MVTPWIEKACRLNPGYSVKIVGYGYPGSGVASLYGYVLRTFAKNEIFKDLKVLTFSPTPFASEHFSTELCSDFVTNFVNGEDLNVRLTCFSLRKFHDSGLWEAPHQKIRAFVRKIKMKREEMKMKMKNRKKRIPARKLPKIPLPSPPSSNIPTQTKITRSSPLPTLPKPSIVKILKEDVDSPKSNSDPNSNHVTTEKEREDDVEQVKNLFESEYLTSFSSNSIMQEESSETVDLLPISPPSPPKPSRLPENYSPPKPTENTTTSNYRPKTIEELSAAISESESPPKPTSTPNNFIDESDLPPTPKIAPIEFTSFGDSQGRMFDDSEEDEISTDSDSPEFEEEEIDGFSVIRPNLSVEVLPPSEFLPSLYSRKIREVTGAVDYYELYIPGVTYHMRFLESKLHTILCDTLSSPHFRTMSITPNCLEDCKIDNYVISISNCLKQILPSLPIIRTLPDPPNLKSIISPEEESDSESPSITPREILKKLPPPPQIRSRHTSNPPSPVRPRKVSFKDRFKKGLVKFRSQLYDEVGKVNLNLNFTRRSSTGSSTKRLTPPPPPRSLYYQTNKNILPSPPKKLPDFPKLPPVPPRKDVSVSENVSSESGKDTKNAEHAFEEAMNALGMGDGMLEEDDVELQVSDSEDEEEEEGEKSKIEEIVWVNEVSETT